MSKLEVNAIEPQTGTTITVGASGDTITVPSGATLNVVGTFAQSGDTGITGAVTITTTDNTAGLTLKCTDADASAGPLLVFHRDSSSPANNDFIGNIQFEMENNASEQLDAVSILGKIADVTDGSEDAEVQFFVRTAGSMVDRFAITRTEVSVNDGSIDSNFRVESDGNANMLFVDGGANRVGIGTNAPGATLEIQTSTDWGNIINSTNSGTQYLKQFEYNGSSIGKIRGDNSSIAIESGSNLILQTANSEKMRIHSSGKVSIGTSTAEGVLRITNATQTSETLLTLEDTGGTGAHSQISLKNTTGVVASILTTSDNLEFRVDDATVFANISGTEHMRIKSDGKVGIGTSAPEVPLSVVGLDTQIHFSEAADGGGYLMSEADSQFRISGGAGFKVGGSGWVAKATEAAIIGHDSGGDIKFFSNTSLTAGNTFTPTERVRISSAGKVSIGNTNASAFGSLATDLVIGTTSGEHGLTIVTGTGNSARMQFSDNTSSPFVGAIEYSHSSNSMIFYTSGSPAFRYAVGGLIIGKSGGTITDTGNYFGGNNGNNMVRAGGTVCGFNRETNDGTIIEFSGDGNIEGTISVSGTTVSYNGFTGTHWSRFTDNSTPTILRGTVLETLDEMCDWYNLEFGTTTTTQDKEGNDVTHTSRQIIPHVLLDSQSVGDTVTYNHEGTDYQAKITKETDIKHMMSKVSDNSDAKNVYGLFIAYDLDGEGYNDFYVASVGSYVVRIKSGETLAKGDLLQSNGDGTAKVQSDDNIKSSSFAKVLSTTIIETYEDGSYLVPCSLMC